MHKLLGGLCAALLFLAGLPQIGHAADPVPLKTAWLGEHEAFAAWYAKQKGWDLEEGFRLEMLSYDSGKQLMAGMNTAHWEIAACGAIPALTASLDNQAEIIAIGNDESLATGIYARKDSPILGHTGYNALYPEMAGTGGTVRGKTILCTAGSSAHYTVHKWLEALSLTEKEVTIKDMPSEEALKAFLSGEGDAVALWSPYTLEAEQHGLMPGHAVQPVRRQPAHAAPRQQGVRQGAPRSRNRVSQDVFPRHHSPSGNAARTAHTGLPGLLSCLDGPGSASAGCRVGTGETPRLRIEGAAHAL